jgi:hypothetical protein
MTGNRAIVGLGRALAEDDASGDVALRLVA